MSKRIVQAKAKLAKVRKLKTWSAKVNASPKPGATINLSPLEPAALPKSPKSVADTPEVKRLRRTVNKLIAASNGAKPKQLYFDERHLAGRWGMSVKHIRTLRYGGVGPKVTYFGRSVRYRLRDIVKFEGANAFTSRSDMEVQTKKRAEEKTQKTTQKKS